MSNESPLDLSAVQNEQPDDPGLTSPTIGVPIQAGEKRPWIALIWDNESQGPIIQVGNCKSYEIMMALLATTKSSIDHRCEMARQQQIREKMMQQAENAAIQAQLQQKHAKLPRF